MAGQHRVGFPRGGLPDLDQPEHAALDEDTAPRTGGAAARSNRGAPRPVKRWRLFVRGGTATAFFRESLADQRTLMTPGSGRRHPSEFAAPPAQPARSSSQARS
jgi:hypothetical protein